VILPPRSLRALALLCLGPALLGGCQAEDRLESALDLPLVVAEPVVLQDLEDRVMAVGELIARNHAEIAAEVDGRVTEILVLEGAAVDAGQPILELDPVKRRLELDRANARVAEARASVENERRQVDRQRELFGRQISSQKALDEAETRLRLAEAKLLAARADLGVETRALDESTVRAPFGGLVVRRRVSLGEYVKVGQPLVEMVSLDPIEVVFRVSEIDSSRVRVGQQVAVHLAPHPDEVFAATVTVVSPTIDPRSRTLRVKAALDNASGRLRPGLFARADLGLRTREDVPVIPSTAVLQRTDGSVVFTVDDELRTHRRVIEIAGFQEGVIEVASGLVAGERVITRGHTELVDGQLVRMSRGDGLAAAGKDEKAAAEAAIQ